jgi:hypothetical protein
MQLLHQKFFQASGTLPISTQRQQWHGEVELEGYLKRQQADAEVQACH